MGLSLHGCDMLENYPHFYVSSRKQSVETKIVAPTWKNWGGVDSQMLFFYFYKYRSIYLFLSKENRNAKKRIHSWKTSTATVCGRMYRLS